ncbi:MAG: hypothetical protein Q9181_007535 [Wetmoreana brouardii]
MGMMSRADTGLPAYKCIQRKPLPAYELIQRNRTESQPLPAPAESDDEFEKPTSRLPPRSLPGRRKYRPFIVATLIAIFTILPFALLIRYIQYMLPDPSWNGLKLDGVSCDLVDTKNASRMQSAFQINLRSAAQLSFAEAKFIDLLFDLAVGQGGRLLLAAVSYIVFMDALLRFMEITPMSYNLYISLAFSSTSLVATWRATKSIFTTKGWRAKMFLIWCALAMMYVLAFPTLIESATGYVQPSSAGFNINNGTFVTANSDNLTSCYIVDGGALIGLTDDTIALGPPAHVFDAANYYTSSQSDPNSIPQAVNRSSLYYQLLTYDDRRIYDATNSTERPQIPANLSYYYEDYDYYHNYTTNITLNGHIYKFHNDYASTLSHSAYCYGDEIIDAYALKKSPFCFTQSYFVWIIRGFSSIVLYVILGLQIIWTFGMYCVWLDANFASELLRNGRTVRGPFRAAADIVEAMNEILGHEYCVYTDNVIEKELEKSGAKIRYYGSLRDDDELLHIGLTAKKDARMLLSAKLLYGAKSKAKRKRGD